MHISWLGTSAFRLQTKHEGKDVAIVIDPYKPKKGSFPRSLTPQVALYTRSEKDSVTLSGDPFVLSTAGECDVQGVLVTAVEGHDPDTTMLRLDVDDMSLGHLGLSSKPLTEKQLEMLNGVDILCIGVGGKNVPTYYPHEAVKVINDIEPKIIIPYAFKGDNDTDAKPVADFLKEMSLPAEKPETKVILKKKDLPMDQTQVIVLSKE